MMNSHLPAVPHMVPAGRMHPGRRPSDLPYAVPPYHTPQPMYPGYAPQPYHPLPHSPQHQQPWYPPYQQMPPLQRGVPPRAPMGVHQYPPSGSSIPPSHQSPPPPSSSSTQSHPLYSPSTSTTSLSVPTPPPSSAAISQALVHPPAPLEESYFIESFDAPVPWYSVPKEEFPPRAPRRRRRRAPQSLTKPLELPSRQTLPEKPAADELITTQEQKTPRPGPPAQLAVDTPTGTTNKGKDEANLSEDMISPSSLRTQKFPGRPAVPVIPLAPVIPRVPTATSIPVEPVTQTKAASEAERARSISEDASVNEKSEQTIPKPPDASTSPPRAIPKSWADLVRTKNASSVPMSATTTIDGIAQGNGLTGSKAGSIADAILSFDVEGNDDENSRIHFLEPRGLVNTGNMCYMNSILQILVYCIPFYQCLDMIGKRAVHKFKSDTPLLDAMIMFMREFSVIDSAPSAEQLRMRLKEMELEQYGEPFIPEFVYDVIRRLPRFSSMRRGHQQDAEEFLGFLLEGLHDECSHVMRSSSSSTTSGVSTPTTGVASLGNQLPEAGTTIADGGWLEIGRKQKAAITRSSGVTGTDSPITKIFGGQIRSELRVPGLKNSVTLEPYQPLQLDIGASNVNNITDALKGLTRPETLHGDFNSPRGPGVTATKQVFIETLPPVLILHLKRFQYDNTGGTQKIWKKIGYPLELEIPKEVFPQHKRGALAVRGGLPRYRLIGVVYHHGKNASGGHYTVDVRRQDGHEWIRLDDTVIRRVRSEDVAEAGSEEDPKILAGVNQQHKRDKSTQGNIYEQAGLGEDEDEEGSGRDDEQGWSQVNGVNGHAKKWSGVVNGTAKTKDKEDRFSVKDKKVAYLLFYQKIKV